MANQMRSPKLPQMANDRFFLVQGGATRFFNDHLFLFSNVSIVFNACFMLGREFGSCAAISFFFLFFFPISPSRLVLSAEVHLIALLHWNRSAFPGTTSH